MYYDLVNIQGIYGRGVHNPGNTTYTYKDGKAFTVPCRMVHPETPIDLGRAPEHRTRSLGEILRQPAGLGSGNFHDPSRISARGRYKRTM